MSKKQKATDPARFEGNGISYRAKLIGIEDVAEARGDKMCQETIQKLKGVVKASGQHKQRIFVNVTLEGLKIIDGTALSVLHTHPVHQISFISRDVTDGRAFGYVFGSGDGSHKFFGIKTANSAENVVLALRDLFQTVYEMKKQEMEEAKAKAAAGSEGETEAKETEVVTDVKPAESEESVEQVAKNNAPVSPQEQEEVVANLLDLEDQVDTILKGIEQIKNLDFEELTDETSGQQSSATTSPASSAPPSTTVVVNDPWGMPAEPSTEPAKTSSSSAFSDLEQLSSPPTSSSNPFGPSTAQPPKVPSSSALSDLEQLSNPPPPSNPFGGMSAFPPAPASSSAAFFGMSQPGMAQPGMAQPGMTQPGMAQPGMSQPGMVQPGMAQPGMAQPGLAQPGMAQPGMAQPGMAQPGMPFGQQGMMGPTVGLPVTKDPFGDPFNTSQAQQPMQTQMMGGSSGGQFGMQAPFGSPFPASMGGAPAAAQPFPVSTATAGAGGRQSPFGRASPSFSPFGTAGPAAGMGMPAGPQGGAVADPFQTSTENFLQPSKLGGQDEKGRPVSPGHANLFDDLVDIKKAGGAESATKSPKEMFQQLSQPAKKSLNEIKGGGSGAGASQTSSSPFGDSFFSTPVNGKPSGTQS